MGERVTWAQRSAVRFFALLSICLGGFLLIAGNGWESRAQEEAPAGGTALVLHIEGPIGPATSDYIVSGLETARERGAKAVILQMDTPGGLDTSMREIIRAILDSSVPVLSYVSPSGARAASAGTYILYASHIAAMAPGTNLGAATPVAVGGGGLPMPGGEPEKPQSGEDEEDGGSGKAGSGDAMKAKMVNDAVAYIRSLAEMRGRNADWAEQAVREAESLSASKALEENVIDIQAATLANLLAQADGRTVRISGEDVTLATKELMTEDLAPDWRNELLALVTSPNVALILMMIGIYGIIFEFMNPGAIYPGTVGAICLVLALYAFAALPVNVAGAGLILLGMVLIVAEAFSPSFGALGIGGTIALLIGATILIDTEAPGFQVSWYVLAGIATATLAFTYLVAHLAVSSFRQRVTTGKEEMTGMIATVLDWEDGRGFVLAHSERWRAVSDAPLEAGDAVTIDEIDGLTLHVSPQENKPGGSRAL
ncbi:NfeD family protein [Tepidicaulis sp. LMO-SS28]|uniref:NfeD family protein n=1 Tax=Tepidicaulis sp. LMO-SS28 TaxID=3447455 RepID=UPI003EE3236B